MAALQTTQRIVYKLVEIGATWINSYVVSI